MSRVRFTQLITELSSHAGLGLMASLVLSLGETAYVTRDYVFPRPGCTTLRAPVKLAQEVARVGDVDVRDVLTRGAQSSEDVDVLCALTLLGVVAVWPKDEEAQTNLTARLLWLETYSGLRCLSSACAVLDGDRQRRLAEVVLNLLKTPSALDAKEAAVGKAWLASCGAPECMTLAEQAQNLAVSLPSTAVNVPNVLTGELGPTPRSGATTTLLAITSLLFFSRAFRTVGRLALNYRIPADLVLESRGLELSSRHELLGRVIKERKQIVPLREIRQVVREVRYPRLGLYAGLGALTVGTLAGTRLFVDGLRVSGISFTMIAWGALLIVLGLVLDLLLSGLSDGVRGKCRLVVRTQKSGAFSLGSLNPSEVDALLLELSSKLKSQ